MGTNTCNDRSSIVKGVQTRGRLFGSAILNWRTEQGQETEPIALLLEAVHAAGLQIPMARKVAGSVLASEEG